jgi:hypothetical protein
MKGFVKAKVADKKMLIYYETFDIIKYCKMAWANEQLFIGAFLKLNIYKIIVIVLLLI